MLCCTYRYKGFADGDEAAFASNIALQAYFEGRKINGDDMKQCLEYWRNNISEQEDPIHRKRSVMCEGCCIPLPPLTRLYRYVCQCKRSIPYKEKTKELEEVRAVR